VCSSIFKNLILSLYQLCKKIQSVSGFEKLTRNMETVISFAELLLQWNRVLANRHEPNTPFVPNLDSLVRLNQILSMSGIHRDPDPNALWFMMAGLLTSFNCLTDVTRNANVLGGFISYQKHHITLFIVQKSPVSSGKQRLSIFSFDIDSGEYSTQIPFNQRRLQQKIGSKFDITDRDVQEAVENTKNIIIKRDPRSITEGQRALGEDDYFSVTSVSKPLPTQPSARHGPKLFPLGPNVPEISVLEIKKYIPHIYELDFDTIGDQTPGIFVKSTKIIAEHIPTDLRPIDSSSCIWIMSGIIDAVKDRLGVRSSVVLSPTSAPSEIFLVKNAPENVELNQNQPLCLSFDTDNNEHGQTSRIVSHQIQSVRSTIKVAHVKIGLETSPIAVETINFRIDVSEERRVSFASNIEDYLCKLTSIPDVERHSAIYLKVVQNIIDLVANCLNFYGTDGLIPFILGQLSHNTYGRDVFMIDTFRDENIEIKTFIIRQGAEKGAVLSLVSGTPGVRTATEGIMIPNQMALRSRGIMTISGIVNILVNAVIVRDIPSASYDVFDLRWMRNVPPGLNCRLYLHRGEIGTLNIRSSNSLTQVPGVLIKAPILTQGLEISTEVLQNENIRNHILKFDVASRIDSNEFTAFVEGLMSRTNPVLHPLQNDPKTLLVLDIQSDHDLWFKHAIYHLDEKNAAKLASDLTEFKNTVNNKIENVKSQNGHMNEPIVFLKQGHADRKRKHDSTDDQEPGPSKSFLCDDD